MISAVRVPMSRSPPISTAHKAARGKRIAQTEEKGTRRERIHDHGFAKYGTPIAGRRSSVLDDLHPVLRQAVPAGIRPCRYIS
jgi:hypothetical protein